MPSINDLPTELDARIARVLFADEDMSSMSALSQVSNNYRVDVEPLLYQSIRMYYYKPASWTRLLLTLLEHPKLALHIHRVHLVTDRVQSEDVDNEQEAYGQVPLYLYRGRISTAIDTVFGKMEQQALHSLNFSEYSARSRRSYQSTTGHSLIHLDHDDDITLSAKDWWMSQLMWKTYQPFDATLALILCMATNLTDVWSEEPTGGSKIIRTLMRARWRSNTDHPFKRLEDLRFTHPQVASGPLPILPSTYMLIVDSLADRNTIDESVLALSTPHPLPPAPKLEILRFINLRNVSPNAFPTLLFSPWVANLKQFTVSNCGLLDNDTDVFDIVHALANHAPQLRKFAFSQQGPYGEFGLLEANHFRDLTNLTQLVVDFDLLVAEGDDDLEAFKDLYAIFPASLEDLSLACVGTETLHSVIAAFQSKFAGAEDPGKAEADALGRLARSVGLKAVTICLYSSWARACKLTLHDVAILRDAADVLEGRGLVFGVCCSDGVTQCALIEPGFTSPFLLEYALEDEAM
ncbi:hypothetical protein T440DRAFT_474268 [Plenodomus tracheiphilus IPT5]|uniref:Uncharacterized protein n=1 Tax=Plenodomus tracheiphilus IPT5 TaxID=1408161 RepID=A0A6A7BPU1_9PLEO|nr:hypothetical protein T440DRAFT_474268 [Plenodomus tracheiphilus IPT5]